MASYELQHLPLWMDIVDLGAFLGMSCADVAAWRNIHPEFWRTDPRGRINTNAVLDCMRRNGITPELLVEHRRAQQQAEISQRARTFT